MAGSPAKMTIVGGAVERTPTTHNPDIVYSRGPRPHKKSVQIPLLNNTSIRFYSRPDRGILITPR